MSNPAFSDFVQRQVDREREPVPDWAHVKRLWLDRLDALYARVEAYLGDYMATGAITLERRPVVIREEQLGEYSATELVVRVGGQDVVLKPIGTVLIGSAGRVDMEGSRGIARIALVPEGSDRPRVQVTIRTSRDEPAPPEAPLPEPDWTWKLIVPGPPMRYITLNEETFQTALMNVADG